MLSRVRGGTRDTISDCVVFGYLQATFGYIRAWNPFHQLKELRMKKSKLGLLSVNQDLVKVAAIQAIKKFF